SRGGVGGVRRRRLQRRRPRADRAQGSRRNAAAHRGKRTRAVRRLAGGEEADRHRQLLYRLVEVRADDRLDASGTARGGVRAHHHFLPRASAAIRGGGVIPFLNLKPGPDAADVRAAMERVVERGWFVLGPELEAFETEFAAACGAAHAVGVGTGTDAIALAVRACGIGPGDEVITAPLSAAYSALAIMMAGARRVFADVDPLRLTLDPQAVAAAVTPRTRAILPVHLYGQPADMTGIMEV